jgi:calcineurin-like phosphoesterase family protein
MPNFLITSDWHFGHANDVNTKGILAFERGNKFNTIQEHDKYITECIEKWLHKLATEDTFYFLGDFGRPDSKTLSELVRIFVEAKCHKVAIRGNHDHETETEIMKTLFDKVYDYPIYISNRIVLSHFPCNVWKDQINIHGHLHGSVLNSPNHVCASIHVAQYQPINNHIVNGCLGRLPKYNRRFLWEPWADKYQFTQKKEDVVYDKDRNIDLAASRVIQRFVQESCMKKSGETE